MSTKKLQTSEWGRSIVQDLSDFIREKEPDVKGFTAHNILGMKQFYEINNRNKKLSSVVREISWTDNLLILSKSNSMNLEALDNDAKKARKKPSIGIILCKNMIQRWYNMH